VVKHTNIHLFLKLLADTFHFFVESVFWWYVASGYCRSFGSSLGVGYAQQDLIFLLRTVTDFIRCVTIVNDKPRDMKKNFQFVFVKNGFRAFFQFWRFFLKR
jgi:hypothetical protein